MTHPTPDQRRQEAIDQATAAFDGSDWPGVNIDAAHQRAFTDADVGLGFAATQPIPRVDLPAERHAELIETVRWEGSALRKTIIGAMVGIVLFFALVLLAAFLTTGRAHAQETRLLVHQLSYHLDRSQDWNEVNPGLGVQYRPWSGWLFDSTKINELQWWIANGYVQAGFYKNSYRRNTVYAAAGSEPITLGPVRMGAFVAVGSGYGVRAVTEQRTLPPPLQFCSAKPCPLPDPQTITTRRVENTSALRAAGGLSASWQGQRLGVQIIAMPPLQVNGQKLSSGVYAASLSVRI